MSGQRHNPRECWCGINHELERTVLVKPGDVRRHKHWKETVPGVKASDSPGAIVRVTAVRNGVVHYGFGADARKGRYYIGIEGFLANTEAV